MRTLSFFPNEINRIFLRLKCIHVDIKVLHTSKYFANLDWKNSSADKLARYSHQ